MDLTGLLLVFVMAWKMSFGLKCYKCTAGYDDSILQQQQLLCEDFDYSEKYYSECENSSMCYKRLITSQFDTVFYERGCAMQTMPDDREVINGKWRNVKKVREVYKEGCEKRRDDYHITGTEHCYCRGDLCNAGWVETSSVLGVVWSAIWLVVLR